MNKIRSRGVWVALIVFFAASLVFEAFTPISTAFAETTGAPSTFSVVWVTDTQYLPESYPSYFDNLCQWIVNNTELYNVKMVIHTGDIIETASNETQWENANQSMSILLNNDVPYCWNAGNHDNITNTSWIGNEYLAFNPDFMAQKPYWVSSSLDGMSTAVRFSVSGWNCLIINIACEANGTTLNWLENLLDAYPNDHVIVATHDYLNLGDNYDSWGASLKTILDEHSNVFLTLNGHYWNYIPSLSANRTESGDRWQLMWNFQEVDSKMGAESARILTFNVEEDTVSVQTYALYENQFLSDSNNNFTLNTNFSNEAAKTQTSTNTPSFPFSLAVTILVAAIVVPSIVFVIRKRRLKASRDLG